jgi:hypothetical protein
MALFLNGLNVRRLGARKRDGGAVGMRLALAGLAVFAGLLAGCSKPPATAMQATVLQLRQELYIGEPSLDVQTLLDRLNVEYSFDPKARQFIGIVRDENPDLMGSGSARIVITVGADGRVTGIELPDVAKGG